MPPPAGGRGAGAAGGTARAARESSRTRDRGGFVSDAARASEVEKENAARAQVGGKRRRVPGLHHDLIAEEAPDGYPLSQVDDETGEARTVVSWKSVSPPRFRAPGGPAAGAAPSRAGGAVVHQLLRLGRGSAAAMQQAKAREDTRRRVCEQLDTWDERARADGDGARAGGGDAERPRSPSNVAAAALLLSDVQAMCAEPAGTPGSTGRPSVGPAGPEGPAGPGTGAARRTPGETPPRRDARNAAGRETAATRGAEARRANDDATRPSGIGPEPGRTRASALTDEVPPGLAGRAAPSTQPRPTARERGPSPAPPEKTNKTPFECDWGDDGPDADFDLAAAAAAAEAAHRARGGCKAGGLGGLETAPTTRAGGGGGGSSDRDVAPPRDGGASNAAAKENDASRDLEPSSRFASADSARREREAREWRVEAEGAALGAFRV